MRNHDIAARKCAHCHRVFSKVEHLRRHQRSHTGERPFKCKYCKRQYARSDVLNRHIRHHHPAAGEDDGDSPPPRPSMADEGQKDGTSPLLDTDFDAVGPGSVAPSCQSSVSPRDRTREEHPNVQTLQIQDHVNNSWEDMQFDVLQELDAPYSEQLHGLRDDGCDLQTMDTQPSRGPIGLLNPEQEFNCQDGFIDPTLALQDFSVDSDAADIMHRDIDFGSVLLDGLLLTPPRSGDHERTQPSKKNISNEQFEQVRRLWPTRRRTVTLTPSSICWDDILLHPEDNVFSSTSLKTHPDPSAPAESSWNLNEICRARLAQSINHHYLLNPEQTLHLVASPSTYGPWDNGLPPTDILDLCLDLYFYRFHVHMPFVHPGTFNACETPSILLFPMCIVGMMILNREVARKMIAHYLPGIAKACRKELASPGLRHCPAPALLTVLGSACLVLFIAACTSELAFEEERQALYEEMVMLARERGLFSPPFYNSALIQAVNDTGVTWKAWARIQSAQRLTACIILADVYSAQILGVMPSLSPADIHTPIIRGDDLFLLQNSQKWKSHLGEQDPWSDTVSISSNTPSYPPGLTGFGLQTVLSVTWLRILTSHRSLSGSSTNNMPDLWTFHPTLQTGARDANSGVLPIVSSLPRLMSTYHTTLKTGNPNSLILWHYLGLCLTTNPPVIEEAAGRNGPEAAKLAVEHLKNWAKSPIARRACLHAIHVLLTVSNQCASDGIMLHTEMALFNAALVLGFYLLTAPSFEEASVDAPCYDLFDDVDWTEVGDLGTSEHASFQHQDSSSTTASSLSSSSSTRSAAILFIQNGGPVCFRGVQYHSPYAAARRSFMNFASQLEEIGRWNVQEYCKVLHIIGDTLIFDDSTNGT